MSDDTRLAEIRARLAAATPGPWYVNQLDDVFSMSFVAVGTSPDDGTGDYASNRYDTLVAATLVQQPRYVCHDDDRWDENAALIAHAPADIAYLLAEVKRLTVERDAALAGELLLRDATVLAASKRIKQLEAEVQRLRDALTALVDNAGGYDKSIVRSLALQMRATHFLDPQAMTLIGRLIAADENGRAALAGAERAAPEGE